MSASPNKFVQLQEDVTAALLASEALSLLPVYQWRKLRLQSEIDLSTIYAMPRDSLVSARAGCGIIVEMPEFNVVHPNLPGPERDLVLPVAVIEEPNLNMQADVGTLLSAEEAAELVLEALHELLIEGLGGLYADSQAIRPANDWEGLVAYRVSLRMRSPRSQTVRVPIPSIVEDALQVTLSSEVTGAAIYYTQDGAYPWPGGKTAVLYTETFELTGRILRWAAYATGMLGSNVGQAAVPDILLSDGGGAQLSDEAAGDILTSER